MKSRVPKVLHSIAGRPLIDRVLTTARALCEERTGSRLVVVVGAGRDEVEKHLEKTAPDAERAFQDPPLGTGDAVRVAATHFGNADRVLVLSGDVPLLRKETLESLLAALDREPSAAVALATTRLPDGGSYGRVVRNSGGRVDRIVEAKDASIEERAIQEINAGVYVFDRSFLDEAIGSLSPDNAAGEYYLTDTLGYATRQSRPVTGVAVEDPDEVLGVNSRADLAHLEGILRARIARAVMEAGVTLIRPETVTLDESVVLEEDVTLGPFVSLTGATRVGRGSRIEQGSVLSSCEIGREVLIRPYSVLDLSFVGDACVVGPFARLREGTVLAEHVHVGNFVETKKARLASGVKANHLSYLGDTTVGERTNVGAGVITCNYDGFAKHTTTIGADVFVGSDSQLVAPVTVGDRAIIGAGTTVTEDVPENALTTSRTRQENRREAADRFRDRRKREPRSDRT